MELIPPPALVLLAGQVKAGLGLPPGLEPTVPHWLLILSIHHPELTFS